MNFTGKKVDPFGTRSDRTLGNDDIDISPPTHKKCDEKYSLLAMVIDRSGSMISFGREVVGGCNTFINEQKKKDAEDGIRTELLFITFDDIISELHSGVDISSVSEITAKDVGPRGMTALHDAIGRSMERVVEILESRDSLPKSVILFFLTDGLENASRRWDSWKIKRQIAKLEKAPYNWSFTFVGANQDALQEGARFGLRASDCLTFTATPEAMDSTMRVVSDSVTRTKRASVATRAHAKAFSPLERGKTM